jgi:hypothetical protein
MTYRHPVCDPDLLFSSMTDKITKNKFFSKVFCLLLFEGTVAASYVDDPNSN